MPHVYKDKDMQNMSAGKERCNMCILAIEQMQDVHASRMSC